MARFGPQRVRVSGGHVDLGAREAVIDGDRRALSPTEADLLGYLAQRAPEQVV